MTNEKTNLEVLTELFDELKELNNKSIKLGMFNSFDKCDIVDRVNYVNNYLVPYKSDEDNYKRCLENVCTFYGYKFDKKKYDKVKVELTKILDDICDICVKCNE